jgi:hypothetical protein
MIDVLRCQLIKLIQVVSTSEFHEDEAQVKERIEILVLQ